MIRRLLLVVPLLCCAGAASALPPDMMKQALDAEVAQLPSDLKSLFDRMSGLVASDPSLESPYALDDSFAKGWTRADCDRQGRQNAVSWMDHAQLASYAAISVPRLQSVWVCAQKEKARQFQGAIGAGGGILNGGNPGPIDTSGLPNAPVTPAPLPPDPGCEFAKAVLAASAGLVAPAPGGGLRYSGGRTTPPEIPRQRDACYAQAAKTSASGGGSNALAQSCDSIEKTIKIDAALSASCVLSLNPAICATDAEQLAAMKVVAGKLGCK